ncbi:hypothetical protein HPB48_019973 [Haemaphysalis longicornis]|uniref:arginine kinase n=1 Tax=Haemaphysalis longicornis TaxID=44386 RepID=A0A9J6GC91_HAELO|nr:hypothetical protein HPB48_019973 [Haemaphysalis longicornis]
MRNDSPESSRSNFPPFFRFAGTRGEHTESEGGVYDISNKRRMGLTEYQAVREMQDGIQELIKLEKAA